MGWFRREVTPDEQPAPPASPGDDQRPEEVLAKIDSFVASTRVAVFVRQADQMLLIRPDKTMGLNRSAARILSALYDRAAMGRPAAEILRGLAGELSVDYPRLLSDAHQLINAMSAILNEDFSPHPMLRFTPFERGRIGFPTLAEIALTYKCQNRCAFCYAASPHREGEHELMTTAQVKAVMGKIFHQAHVPSISFTGGEATLRADLCELISHGKELGFRVNLISNGVRVGDPRFARRLADAGLDSAQISLEAGEPLLHDEIVGRPGAFEQTVRAVRNLRQLGLHVHTNTTLCGDNIAAAGQLIRYCAGELGLQVMSMNMLIRTGQALDTPRMEISYHDIAERLPGLLEVAQESQIKLVWYSPVPYCIFNPIFHGLGAKSCACVDGILSVDPSGQVLPCSSFGQGIGSLLEQDFDEIYHSEAARYWREKRYLPPGCQGCPHTDICGGACPLYWDEAGGFGELPLPEADDPVARRRWEAARHQGGSFGVDAPSAEQTDEEGRSWAP